MDFLLLNDIHLLSLLAITAFGILFVRNLLAVILLAAVYSLLSAGLFVMLDAVDVAFTEAAVGAGATTVLMLGALALTTDRERVPKDRPLLPLFIILITGAALIYATLDMPAFGDPGAPIHQHVAPHYLLNSYADTGSRNVVTAVLASYRGFDTLGEVVVVFMAALGVLALLGRGSSKAEDR